MSEICETVVPDDAPKYNILLPSLMEGTLIC